MSQRFFLLFSYIHTRARTRDESGLTDENNHTSTWTRTKKPQFLGANNSYSLGEKRKTSDSSRKLSEKEVIKVEIQHEL